MKCYVYVIVRQCILYLVLRSFNNDKVKKKETLFILCMLIGINVSLSLMQLNVLSCLCLPGN